jgi:transketolase
MERKSDILRKTIFNLCCKAKVGHISSAVSCVDILIALYYGPVFNYQIGNPKWEDRDRFILSKGHAGVALYPILADLEYFPREELDKMCTPGSLLGGHPGKNIPGIEIGSGSLGYGLGVGCGMATAAKLQRKLWMTYVLMGDGECYEGAVWEAAMFASHNRLNNLVGIIDRNYQSATDFTENIIALEPLSNKWEAFGWDVQVVNGHNIEELIDTFIKTKSRNNDKPKMVIANTIKGYGIEYMEYNPTWHARLP